MDPGLKINEGEPSQNFLISPERSYRRRINSLSIAMEKGNSFLKIDKQLSGTPPTNQKAIGLVQFSNSQDEPQKPPPLEKDKCRVSIFSQAMSNYELEQSGKGSTSHIKSSQNSSNKLSRISSSKFNTEHELCFICYMAESNSLNLPCGHGGFCIDCGKNIVDKSQECCICRSEVEQLVQIDLKNSKNDCFRVLKTFIYVDAEEVDSGEDSSERRRNRSNSFDMQENVDDESGSGENDTGEDELNSEEYESGEEEDYESREAEENGDGQIEEDSQEVSSVELDQDERYMAPVVNSEEIFSSDQESGTGEEQINDELRASIAMVQEAIMLGQIKEDSKEQLPESEISLHK